jgi:hypothetical protein
MSTGHAIHHSVRRKIFIIQRYLRGRASLALSRDTSTRAVPRSPVRPYWVGNSLLPLILKLKPMARVGINSQLRLQVRPAGFRQRVAKRPVCVGLSGLLRPQFELMVWAGLDRQSVCICTSRPATSFEWRGFALTERVHPIAPVTSGRQTTTIVPGSLGFGKLIVSHVQTSASSPP